MNRFCTVSVIFAFCILATGIVQSEETGRSVTFALVGDIMLGTDFPDSLRNLPPYEGRDLFRYVRGPLSEADVAIGNLECAITTADSSSKVVQDSIAYVFRVPPYLAPRLKEAGFDVLNTANNHTNDFGDEGRFQTESILDSLGIAHTGRTGRIAELDIAGISVAVAGFSTTRGSHSLIDIDGAAALISALDGNHDIVVVTFHGGAEGKEFTHQPDGPECFLGENRGDLRLFARRAVDAGADIVFGHGPHVPRGMELYQGRLIAYSLGNFCTWFGVNVQDVNGLAPLIRAEVNADGSLRGVTILSFEQQSRHYPIPDRRKRAEKLMIELSEEDIGSFPAGFLLSK